MTELLLQFEDTQGCPPQLVLTHYRQSAIGTDCRAVRGQSIKGRGACGTFALSSGVLGMIAAVLKAKIANQDSDDGTVDWLSLAGISSKDTPLAVAFDHALSKEPNWLAEMFGADASGRATARRLFIRENPERKRPGPVVIALNRSALPPENISIQLSDGRPIDTRQAQTMLSSICSYDHKREALSSSAVALTAMKVRHNKLLRDGLTAENGILDADSVMQVLANVESSLFGEHIAKVESLLLHTLCSRVVETLAPPGATSCGSVVTILDGNPVMVVAQPAAGSPSILRVALESSVSSKHQHTIPCPPEARFLGIEIWTPPCLSRYAEELAIRAMNYWTAAYRNIRGWLHVAVRRLNPPIIDELYRVLRQQIALSSGDETLLNGFSLFLHSRGKCRYVLDDLRHQSVRSALLSNASIWRRGDDGFSRMAQTEAWYSTSVNASADTMSFNEAILPRRSWSGTPNTWTTPIPGFGASEVAVYGSGVSWAVPLDFGTSPGESAITCCAVFTDTVAHAIREPLATLHPIIRPRMASLAQQLAQLPLSLT